MKSAFALVCAVALTACSQKPTAKAAYTTDVPMAEFMSHVVDPAALMLWNAGSPLDEARPDTEEAWDTRVTGATILVEAGNALQLPGRPRAPEADWNRHAKALSERALIARAAADNHDTRGVFDAGARIYEVCVTCHQQFVLRPGGGAKDDLPMSRPGAPRS